MCRDNVTSKLGNVDKRLEEGLWTTEKTGPSEIVISTFPNETDRYSARYGYHEITFLIILNFLCKNIE